MSEGTLKQLYREEEFRPSNPTCPTDRPTYLPTDLPTYRPTNRPSDRPTDLPTDLRTGLLTYLPTYSPTYQGLRPGPMVKDLPVEADVQCMRPTYSADVAG